MTGDVNTSRRPGVFDRLRKSALFPLLLASNNPLDLRIVGRTLAHAALVGAAAGLTGALFFGGLEYLQHLLLENLAGYAPLRAHGERFVGEARGTPFRPWLLALLPAVGGLLCGLITRSAPETRGGGGDAMIDAFHHRGGVISGRVIWIKTLASMCTLGTGGAGGREGPTMQIGGALGSWVARVLHVGARERRILLVAGVAAGISAVFRTPLGAALLAVEILYKDGFESEALIPSVLASVIAYSIVIAIFGESTLFGDVPRSPFVIGHLPLFALLALAIAALAVFFLWFYKAVASVFAKLRVPEWSKPALGGLVLGAAVTPFVLFVGRRIDQPGQGLGLLGGGYGAVQMAISGSDLLPLGWFGVGLLLVLSVAKMLTASLTIGSGGSAGDFAPCLAIGGLFGGAFGRAAQLLLEDPRLHPGAFALVGMSAFYGGIAHVPLSALVLACELAGNYDLLVPLMLSQGIAFVALRRRALYGAQVATQRESPVHRDALLLDVLRETHVGDVVPGASAQVVCFTLHTSMAEMVRIAGEEIAQEIFPIRNEASELIGLVTAGSLRIASAELDNARWTLAADIMQPSPSVARTDDLRFATERMLANGLRELPIVDAAGRVTGLLNAAQIADVYIRRALHAEPADSAPLQR
ncbi:MAG TPA: chloride channel protein [Polyangiaceae bacterium]|nr:chloride channel protein [Polyangiaceae bacterium]